MPLEGMQSISPYISDITNLAHKVVNPVRKVWPSRAAVRESIRNDAGGEFMAKVVAHLCQSLKVSLGSISATWLIMDESDSSCFALFDCPLRLRLSPRCNRVTLCPAALAVPLL